MAGCWLPRTTMPATGAMAKRVVEGLAGMFRSSGKIGVSEYSGECRIGQQPEPANSRLKPAKRPAQPVRTTNDKANRPPPPPAPAAARGRP
ncbi:hypothetical protein AL532_27825 [Pseudomonas monteilii]|uniref:Uncharacterized protein n=1 Tax=Pseudomonas monteilii TaxID=76759 RepID=A0A7X3F6P9_9PSED|nr:hypothetical protein AL532_27825 [Pseudomonas monteilii]MVF52450.1 hypothetical protein [Pseudomonas monteilii]